MSCGISTSFPVLSPTVWQVAHALLTRPPLLRTRRYFTVRLECVMHAASVHPEPGSNSLKNCISTGLPRIDSLLFRVIFRSNYSELLNSKEFSESFVHRCCSIFNEPSAAPFGDSLFILPQTGAFVNPFSKLFSKFFLRSLPRQGPPLRGSSRILSRRAAFVKAVFQSFSSLSILFTRPGEFSQPFVHFPVYH